MPHPLVQRLRARGFVMPDYDGGGLLNVAATVLDVLGARDAGDAPPLSGLDPALREAVRQVVVILADGLGWWQLQMFCDQGDAPFLAELRERARARDRAQLLEATTVFPSTTAAAITTLNTARTPLEHGNIAYFIWLEEFAQVTAMLRWGPATARRGSYFDDPSVDPKRFVLVPSIHARLRDRGIASYIIEPEIFRAEAMTRMHAAEASHAGYVLASSMGVRLRALLDAPRPSYVYAYWSGIDTVSHVHGPRSEEAAMEVALFDLDLRRALGHRRAGDTLVILTADHGHAATDPDKMLDVVGDVELRALLRNPPAGEPRLVFLHTDRPGLVRDHVDRRWPGLVTLLDRDELIEAGLFGRGDPTTARRRIGEVVALLDRDLSASIVEVEGQTIRHRGSHGGMTADEMRIPVLAWRA
ncbi:MAG: alkaline phosphatase family protein [Chloroflexota bacterium]